MPSALPKHGRKGGISRQLAEEAFAHFLRLGSLGRAGAIYGRSAGSVAYWLARHGLRPRSKPTHRAPRRELGRFLPSPEPTEKEVSAAISRLSRVMIPAELNIAWRAWSPERRREILRRMHAHIDALRPRQAVPATPFSANVEPWDYASPNVQAIVAARNAGLTSRQRCFKVKLASRGVVWEGELYYWVGGYYYSGVDRSRRQFGAYRRNLVHLVWSRHHGRPVPAAHVVVHRDRNRNNFDPENLALKSRNELARENQSAALLKRSRAATALLLERSMNKEPHAHRDTLHQIKRPDRPTSRRHVRPATGAPASGPAARKARRKARR